VPFTLAHAAAALPFQRLGLVPSALIIGTFAPDFEYFLRLGPSGGYGHTLAGAFLLSLPLGLAVLWLFHATVKAPAASLLPESLQDRLPLDRFRFGGLSRFAFIVASLLLGIATHLGWDSFTHRTMWLYWHWPLLRQWVHVWGIGQVPVYKILQHVSTAVGLLILLAWFRSWYRSTTPCQQVSLSRLGSRKKLAIAGTNLAIAAGLALVRAAYGAQTPYEGHVLTTFAGEGVCTFIAACWWQLVLLGAFQSRWRPSNVLTDPH